MAGAATIVAVAAAPASRRRRLVSIVLRAMIRTPFGPELAGRYSVLRSSGIGPSRRSEAREAARGPPRRSHRGPPGAPRLFGARRNLDQFRELLLGERRIEE